MKVSVLASGSKGNSTFIETGIHKILIDLGTSSLYVESKLKELGINPNDIDGIFITHTHVDHINGLRVFVKKYKPILYLTELMLKDLEKIFPIQNFYILDKENTFEDLCVTLIKTSHDVADSNGFLMESNGKSVVHITDTGYLNQKYQKLLHNRDIYIMESNHDVSLLLEGRYPYHIKQRINGDRGHLSNKDCTYHLSRYIGENTKSIVLIHLSEDNNRPELAYETLKESLDTLNYRGDILISEQKEKTELIEV